MWTYVAAAVGVVVALAVAWDLRAHFVNRRVAAGLIPVYEQLRGVATESITHREPRADEPLAADLQPLFDAAQRELEGAGLTVLGDVMEQRADGTPVGIVRWFIDPGGTMVGWFGVVRNAEAGSLQPAMLCFSETAAGQFFVTARGAPPSLVAGSPAIRRIHVPWDAGLAATLAAHRGALEERGAVALRQAAARDAAAQVLWRLREENNRWRRAQPPDALLDLDVHAMLAEVGFEPLGPHLIKLLRTRAAS